MYSHLHWSVRNSIHDTQEIIAKLKAKKDMLSDLKMYCESRELNPEVKNAINAQKEPLQPCRGSAFLRSLITLIKHVACMIYDISVRTPLIEHKYCVYISTIGGGVRDWSGFQTKPWEKQNRNNLLSAPSKINEPVPSGTWRRNDLECWHFTVAAKGFPF